MIQSIRIALQVAESLTVVRDSLLPSGAPYLSDFWGDGAQYVLCRWPGEGRQYCVSTSKGVQADPYLLNYMPPDYTPDDVPGSASDSYFIGVLLERLLGGRGEGSSLPPPVLTLLEGLLAERAGERPDAVIALRTALEELGEGT
ncbi:MAG: hypothetical protein M3Y56_16370 [Armatimonadota bacterium]|nr:hypothetical protein [Armatimonadota bacterium]